MEGAGHIAVQDIIRRFYESLEQKSDAWQRDVADEVVFADASKTLHTEGRAAFIQAFTPFLRSVEHVHLRQLIVEADDAAAVVGYDYVSPSGARMSQDDVEIWKIVDGKVAALTVYFDTTEFRAFMGR